MTVNSTSGKGTANQEKQAAKERKRIRPCWKQRPKRQDREEGNCIS
jgi:hypothetical protein